MAQSRAESIRDTYNYGQYLNQYPAEYDIYTYIYNMWGFLTNLLESNIVFREFDLQSSYNVYFRTDTLRKIWTSS